MRFVIARSEATKQSRVARETLDCLAALAMTGVRKQNPPSFATAGFGVSAQTSSAALVGAQYAIALMS